MPRKTDGEKVDELEKLGAALIARCTILEVELESIYQAHAATAKTLAEFRRELDREIALLKRDLADLQHWRESAKKGQEEWSRRLWAFGPNLLAALLGGAIAAAISYSIPRP